MLKSTGSILASRSQHCLGGGGGGEGWTVRCFVPLMHFCIGKYQSVPRLLARIVCQFLGQQSSFVCKSAARNRNQQVVVGINFGHAEWPIYRLKLISNKLLTSYYLLSSCKGEGTRKKARCQYHKIQLI